MIANHIVNRGNVSRHRHHQLGSLSVLRALAVTASFIWTLLKVTQQLYCLLGAVRTTFNLVTLLSVTKQAGVTWKVLTSLSPLSHTQQTVCACLRYTALGQTALSYLELLRDKVSVLQPHTGLQASFSLKASTHRTRI